MFINSSKAIGGVLLLFISFISLSKEYCITMPTGFSNYSGGTTIQDFCAKITTTNAINVLGMTPKYGNKCCQELTLTCDQDVSFGQIILSTNSGNPNIGMDISSLPTIEKTLCTDTGFSQLDNTLLITQQPRKYDNSLYASAICGGKTSRCANNTTPVGLIVPDAITTCNSAPVEMKNIRFKTSDAMTFNKFEINNYALSKVCFPMKFSQARKLTSFFKTLDTGLYSYYTANAVCTNYTGSTPIVPECKYNATTPFIDGIQPIDCDSAIIKLGSIPLPIINNTVVPTLSNNKVRTLVCNANGYDLLSSVITTTLTPGGVDAVNVIAKCAGNTKAQQCNINGNACLGAVIQSTNISPKICINGICYKDTCASVSTPTCALCSKPTLTFTDAITAEVCTVTKPPQRSGEAKKQSFITATHNGVYNTFCNSGSLTVYSDSTCFKNCTSSMVSWKDKNGVLNCGNNAPSINGGVYKQGEQILVKTSLTNTGYANAKCNNGEWDVLSNSICKLDCTSTVNWGSGVSKNGLSKNGLCSSTPPTTKHSKIFNVTNSSIAHTTGTVSLLCNDGNYQKSNPICNVSCRAKTVSWGGQCNAAVPEIKSGESTLVNHSINTGYTFNSTISGATSLSCDDGLWSSPINASCRYVVSETYSDSSWSWVGNLYGCSNWSPLTNPNNSNTTWVQTATNCKRDRIKLRSPKQIWNDGKVTHPSPYYITEIAYNIQSQRTMGAPHCAYNNNNMIVVDYSSSTEYGYNSVESELINYVYNGVVVYSTYYNTITQPVKSVTGNLAGYTLGKLIPSASYGSTSINSVVKYDVYEICK